MAVNGNALISLRSAVKQEDDAPAVVCMSSGQLDIVVDQR